MNPVTAGLVALAGLCMSQDQARVWIERIRFPEVIQFSADFPVKPLDLGVVLDHDLDLPLGARTSLPVLVEAYADACRKQPSDPLLWLERAMFDGLVARGRLTGHGLESALEHVATAEAVAPDLPAVHLIRFLLEMTRYGSKVQAAATEPDRLRAMRLFMEHVAAAADALAARCPRERHEAIAYTAELAWITMQLGQRAMAAAAGQELESTDAAVLARCDAFLDWTMEPPAVPADALEHGRRNGWSLFAFLGGGQGWSGRLDALVDAGLSRKEALRRGIIGFQHAGGEDEVARLVDALRPVASDATSRLTLAWVHRTRGELEQALEALESHDPGQQTVVLTRALLLLNLHRTEAAQELLQALPLPLVEPQVRNTWRHARAVLAAREGRIEEAIQLLRDMHPRASGHAEASLTLQELLDASGVPPAPGQPLIPGHRAGPDHGESGPEHSGRSTRGSL